jgi:hypothetical protein
MKKDRKLREEIIELQKGLSRVKGLRTCGVIGCFCCQKEFKQNGQRWENYYQILEGSSVYPISFDKLYFITAWHKYCFR